MTVRIRTWRQVVAKVLADSDFTGAETLARQLPATTVIGGQPACLDLAVSRDVPAADCPDGRIPGRALVGESGEVILWVEDGYLSALEYAWASDEPPAALPAPEQIRVHPEQHETPGQ